ncbi:MAG: PQQ-like beta-propeller repeat protein [candidate division Zixibacteria bacterium]|nr:PQQ-like beta-propeller repeat protein [candidate division Zixibacteria bacterium]
MIRYLAISVIILMFTIGLFAQTSENAPYHLGWIWPDSLPKLQDEFAIGDNGYLFVFDESGTLYCLDDSEIILWTASFEHRFVRSPVLANEAVYFLNVNDLYRADKIDLVVIELDGKLRWKLNLGKAYYENIHVSPSGDVYMLATASYSLTEVHTGIYRVTPECDGHYYDQSTVPDGELIGFNSDGNLIFWDEIFVERKAIVSPDIERIEDCRINIGYSPRSLKFGVDEIIYCTKGEKDKDHLMAFNSDCDLIWKYTFEDEELIYFRNTMAVDNHNVYINTGDGSIYAFNNSDGSLRWKSDRDSDFKSLEYLVPSGDGLLFTVGPKAILSALDSIGNIIWNHTMYGSGEISEPRLSPEGDLFVIQAGRLFKFTGDSTQITQQPKPVPLPADKNEAEQEIISFMLDFIVDEIQQLESYLDTVGNYSKDSKPTPPDDNIIIYCPVIQFGDGTYIFDDHNALSIWLYIEDTLKASGNRHDAIKEFMRRLAKNPPEVFWRPGRYEFGIVSIDDSYQTAEVYYQYGPEVWHKFMRRSPSGKWWVFDRNYK